MKRLLSIVFAFCMAISMLPVTVTTYAEGDWAYVKWANGTETQYSTFPAAWNAATSSGDKNTVGLLKNWDGGRFVVPEGKTLTLELNGYVLTRDLADQKSDGEVLYVSKKARLNVYGGNQENLTEGSGISHSVYVYVANADRYGYTRRKETLYGGIVNGGNSSDAGGGIHMKENAKVYLYNVTIAGNRAGAKTVEFGDGGGIEMDESYGYLYMQDSQVIYNCARYDGGGVHVDQSYNQIEMVRSRIDHNVADDNGGGIYVDGNHFSLKGDAKQIMDPEGAISEYGINDWNGRYNYFPPVNEIGSSISYNCVFDAEDGGGGIYCNNQTELIEGVNIFGNIATNTDDQTYGGGIYLNEEEMTVRRCNIFRNKADQLGGGIYNRGDDNILDRDDNTVDSCSIVMNLGMASNGAGGGIYVYRYCDLNVSGPTIVRGNVSKSFGADNLFLSTDGATINAYLIPSTSPGADIHIRYSTAGASGHSDQVSRDAGSYDIQHFSYDNDSNKHFGWDRDWDDRVLKLVDGKKPAAVTPTVFTPDAGKRIQVIDSGYNGYELIKGIVSYPSFPDEDADIENVFYYSDGFFAGDTNTYNPQLATLSMCLTGAAGYSNEYGKDDSKGDYLDKSQNFRQFVSDIGCKDGDIFVNDFNTQKPGSDTIGVGIASKNITINNVEKKLVIIGVRGMGYEKEWISNMTLGAEGEAAGWSSAASQVMAELKGYLNRKGIDGSSENTIFWIAGYSRAGATANLTAKRIVDTYDNNGTHTFAYPVEAPMGGVESAIIEGHNYNCIHNIINQNDIVPWVGTTEMGFIRYGVDHYVPGSTELKATPSDGDSNGQYKKNNIPEDNTAWDVENTLYKGYANQLPKMLKQLTAVNQDILFDDYYHQATINYLAGAQFGTEDMIGETSSHEDQVGTTEHFIEFFFDKLQEYAFKYGTSGMLVSDTYAGKPRAYFSSYKIDGGITFQQAAAAAAGVVFGMDGERKDALLGSMNGFMDRLDGKTSLYFDLDKGGIKDGELVKDLKNVWKQIKEPSSEQISKGARSIKEFLTAEEFNTLDNVYVALLFPILCFVGIDYDEWGQDVVGSAAYNIPRIIANHYPEVTHSWLRSYDYLYANDTTPVVMDPSFKTEPSHVMFEITHADGTAETSVPGSSGSITLKLDDVIRLIPSDSSHINTGEAIYYQLTYGKDQVIHAYSEPLRAADLARNNVNNTSMTMNVTAAHDGTKLSWTENIRLEMPEYATLSYPTGYQDGAYQYTDADLVAGQSTTITAVAPGSDRQFIYWYVYHYENREQGTMISPTDFSEYFGADFDWKSANTTVTNMKGVSARFVPVYSEVITNLTMTPAMGEYMTANGPLPSDCECTGQKSNGTVTLAYENDPVAWRFDSEKQRYIGLFRIKLPDECTLAEKSELRITWNNLNNFSIRDPQLLDIVISNRDAKQLVKDAILTVAFAPADTAGADGAYLDDSAYAILNVWDINKEAVDSSYYFYECDKIVEEEQTFIHVVAPLLHGMKFVSWQDLENPIDKYDPERDFDIDGGQGNTITANYCPIVSEVSVALNKAPTADETVPTLDSVTVTIENQWRIDNAVLSWSPDDKTADYGTVYSARITVDKKNMTGTNLNDPGSGSVSLAGAFALADDLTVAVKDAGGNDLPITNRIFTQNDQEISLNLVFKETENPLITGFADVSIVVPHGSSSENILSQLPAEVNAYLEDGRMVSVPVVWDSVSSYDPSAAAAQVVTASGHYTGSDYTLAEDVSLTASVTVLGREQTAAPDAIPGAGDYRGLQKIRLTADEDATIKYTIKTYTEEEYYIIEIDPETNIETGRKVNPDLPEPAETDFLQYTEPVTLTQYDVITLLYTYASKDGLADSDIVRYKYTLTKPEVTKLEAKAATIAENGNIECWYSKKLSGFDAEGNPIYNGNPDQYYRDEACTVLLDYDKDVIIPAFIATTHTAAEEDAAALCIRQPEEGSLIYGGFETPGVQAIGTEGTAARVLTVLDSRIISAATDYGYLFGTGDGSMTIESAQYNYSCKTTSNNLYGDDNYLYVTAKITADFLNPDMKAAFYVKLENGTDYIYTDPVSCEATISSSSATDEATDNITVSTADERPEFVSHQLILSGQLGMYFYMNIPEEIPVGTMTFTVGDWSVTAEGDLQNDGRYRYVCYVNSVEMAEEIAAKYTYQLDGETKTVSDRISVREYLETIINNAGKVPEYTAATPLAKAIYNYGYYAMQAVPDGTKHPAMPDTYAGETELITSLDDYAIEATLDKNVITKAIFSLNLDSETAINFYLTTETELTKDNVFVTSDATFDYTVEKVGSRYRVQITGISAHELGTVFTMTTGSTTISASAMSYVQQSLANCNATQPVKNAAAALYEYYQKAISYGK